MAATLAIAKNVTSKTYMSGMSSFFDAVSDPDRYGKPWFEHMAASVVPSGLAAEARREDPYMRTAAGMVDAIKRRVPGMSKDLPPVRDLWGRPTDYRSGEGATFDALSPVYIKREHPEPIDKELERLGYYPDMPPRKIQIDGVPLDLNKAPELYAEFVRLAGNDAKNPDTGLGAKDYLNGVMTKVDSDAALYWQAQMTDGPDGVRAGFIRDKVRMYRELAKHDMITPGSPGYSPKLRAMYDLGAFNQQQARQ